MKVLTIGNHKGGCGKTTTASNVAAYLALSGKNVLLIDLDPQGAATLGLGIDKKTLKLQMYDVMRGETTLKDVVRPTEIPGLEVAPCDLKLITIEHELATQPGREFILKERIENIDNTKYDYIVIDTPPNLSILTLNSLIACDELIIPVQCEYYALEGVDQLQVTLNILKNRLGRDPKIRVVLTMFDARTKLSKEVAENVRDFFKDNVFKTVIPRSIKLAEAPSHGKPIHLHAPDSPGALAYKALTEEVLCDV
jgi:chromosome partitioning protein